MSTVVMKNKKIFFLLGLSLIASLTSCGKSPEPIAVFDDKQKLSFTEFNQNAENLIMNEWKTFSYLGEEVKSFKIDQNVSSIKVYSFVNSPVLHEIKEEDAKANEDGTFSLSSNTYSVLNYRFYVATITEKNYYLGFSYGAKDVTDEVLPSLSAKKEDITKIKRERVIDLEPGEKKEEKTLDSEEVKEKYANAFLDARIFALKYGFAPGSTIDTYTVTLKSGNVISFSSSLTELRIGNNQYRIDGVNYSAFCEAFN